MDGTGCPSVGTIKKQAGHKWSPVLPFSLSDSAPRLPAFFDCPHWSRAGTGYMYIEPQHILKSEKRFCQENGARRWASDLVLILLDGEIFQSSQMTAMHASNSAQPFIMTVFLYDLFISIVIHTVHVHCTCTVVPKLWSEIMLHDLWNKGCLLWWRKRNNGTVQ